jgi:CRP/FNR family transcriptional regulator
MDRFTTCTNIITQGLPFPRMIDLITIKNACQSCSLVELCLPRGMGMSDVARLDEVVKRQRKLLQGQHLFREGDESHMIYAVRNGAIKTCNTTREGSEQVLGFHLPGELLGLDGLEDDRHHCGALALEDSIVCELPLDGLEALCHSLPGLYQQMLRILGREIGDEHEMLLLLGKKHAEARLAAFLLNLSARFSDRGQSGAAFDLPMSRQDIGNYLGLAVETVSRLFARFQEENLLVADRRHVTLNDFERLRSIAS